MDPEPVPPAGCLCRWRSECALGAQQRVERAPAALQLPEERRGHSHPRLLERIASRGLVRPIELLAWRMRDDEPDLMPFAQSEQAAH